MPSLKKQHPQLKLHLIGHLQSNKAAEAVKIFDMVHSVDSIKLAKLLHKEMQKQGKHLDYLLQVNIGEEPQKHGILPKDIASFLAMATAIDFMPKGLMCIPPQGEEPTTYFALLKKYALENNLPILSMGMSADYQKAIQVGCSYVRIGTAIWS